MKIIKIKSGLGNQMFQYAFAKAYQANLAKIDACLCQDKSTCRSDKICAQNNFDAQEQIYLDTSQYEFEHIHNNFELENLFNIDINLACKKDVLRLATVPNTTLARIRRKFFTKKTHYIENENIFDKDVFALKGDYYIEGYWQNPAYFDAIKGSLHEIFAFKKPLNAKTHLACKQCQSGTCASLHVRRGDYLLSKNKNLNVCTSAYYKCALDFLMQKVQIDNLFIFSDDIAWCKNEFANLSVKCIFVDWNNGLDSFQDLYLMSKMHHNIIANSSFSFWGAYLNQNPNKIVIAPKKWTNTSAQTRPAILPPNWVGL